MTDEAKVANAIKWIDGLAVTRNKQGQGQLGDEETGFCCLGYACHILGIEFEFDATTSEQLVDYLGFHDNDSNFYDPDFRARYVMVETDNGDDSESVASLIEVNDETDSSFEDISEIIKQHLEKIFEPSVANKLINHYAE